MTRLLVGFLALASSAPAADPGAAAVRFLDRLRGEAFALATDTALSPDATAEKTEAIRERLQQLGGQIGDGELKVIAEKTDGALAAVLVSEVFALDPSSLQVHAVGLLRREKVWLPAPVPASFENTGIRYHPQLGPAAQRLEAWMLRQRPIELARLRETLEYQLLEQVQAAVAPGSRVDEPPERLAERFIEACRARNLAAAGALVIGPEDPPPPGWQGSLALIAAGIRSAGSDRDAVEFDPRWLHAPVHSEVTPETAVVSLGFFNPGLPRPSMKTIVVRHFQFGRNPAGDWLLELPDWLGGPGGPIPLEASMTALHRAFPPALFEKAGTQAFATPDELGEATMRALVGRDFPPLLRLVEVDDETSASEALMRFAGRWSGYQANGNLCFLLDHHREGDRACGLYAEIDPYQPDVREDWIRPLAMVRTPDGWRLADDPELPTDPLRRWFTEALEGATKNWLDRIGLSQRLGGLPPGPAPDADAARRAARAWIDALQARDPRRMLGQAAVFDDIRALKRLFSFIGQEFPNSSGREILAIHRNSRWAAASIRQQPVPGGDDAPLDLLYPIISTASGAKVLPEAVLHVPDTRPRRFLNNEVWKRLGRRLPEPAIEELRDLLEDHIELCQPPETPEPPGDP